MAAESLNCWHCGGSLEGIPRPIGLREECPACGFSLHVCRMCEFYDPGVSKDCREPMADEVSDKEAANPCDYFRPCYGLSAEDDRAAADSRARLEAVFGGVGGARPKPGAGKGASEADAARRKLDSLFGEGKD